MWGATLYSSAAVNRTVEWAVQLPVCSGKVPWSQRLNRIFSNEWECELDSVPGCSGRSSFKTGQALCCLNSGWLTSQVPWMSRAMALPCKLLALPAHLSTQALLDGTTCRCCLQPFQSDGDRRHCIVGRADSIPQLRLGRPGSRASRTSQRTWIRQICTPLLSFLVSVHPWLGPADEKSCWLGLLLGTTDVNSVKIPVLAVASSPPFSLTARFLVVAPHRFSWNPHGARSE